MTPKSLLALLILLTLAALGTLVLERRLGDQGPGALEAGSRGLEPTGNGFPLELELPVGGRLCLSAPPRRVLPANAGATDYVVALLPPAAVVALPRAAEWYSRTTGGKDWSEVPRFESYTAEVVLGLDPDLVLTHAWQSPETTALLADRGIPALVTTIPRSWSEVLATLELYGRVLGVPERAAELALSLEQRRAAIRRPREVRTALSYSNFGPGGSTAGSGTTVDVIFALCGIENAATAAGIEGYAALDHERLLALDPDLILVSGESEDGSFPPALSHLRSTEALAPLVALREDRVVALPSELFSTTSFELITAAERLSEEIARLEE